MRNLQYIMYKVNIDILLLRTNKYYAVLLGTNVPVQPLTKPPNWTTGTPDLGAHRSTGRGVIN